MNKVSVIMTNYNKASFLKEAILSILNQTYSDIELIIIDDASTDESLLVLKSFLSDNRVVVLSSPVNIGTYCAKNLGLLYATGDFICFQDADDRSLPTRIQKQIQPLLNNPELSFTTCNYVRFDLNGLQTKKERLCHLSPFFRKKALNQVGFFDSVRIAADTEFMLRMEILLGPPQHLNEVLYSALEIEGLTSTFPIGGNIRANYMQSFQVFHEKIKKGEHNGYLSLASNEIVSPIEIKSQISLNATDLIRLKA